jgi:serine/threonine protein kinase
MKKTNQQIKPMSSETRQSFFVDIPAELVRTMKLSLAHMPDDEKIGTFCLPSEELHRVFKNKVGNGARGTIMSACTEENPECTDYVAKVERWNVHDSNREQNFRLECGLYHFASEKSFGPKVECCVICQNENSQEEAGLIVMERLDRTMFHKLALQRLTEQECESAFQAIGQMHAAGIWHADLIPSNIMFDKKGKAFIIDFDHAWPFLDTRIPPILRMVDYVRCAFPMVSKRGSNEIFKNHHSDVAITCLKSKLGQWFGDDSVEPLIYKAYSMTVWNHDPRFIKGHFPKMESLKMYQEAIREAPVDVLRRFGNVLIQMRTSYLLLDKDTDETRKQKTESLMMDLRQKCKYHIF